MVAPGGHRREDLVDPFGRVIRDLRISVTDRCNFRCTYCMPAEGMTWLPRSEVLTFVQESRGGQTTWRFKLDRNRDMPTVQAAGRRGEVDR